MLAVRVTVPIACFRKGLAREYLETEPLPPPSTCYGFLLSLVGETRRKQHIGCRVTPVVLNKPDVSVVLRTVWRIKDDNYYVDPNGKHHVVSSTKKTRDAFEKWVEQQGWPKPEYSFGQGSGTNARPDYQQLLSPVELLIWLDCTEETPLGPNLEQRVREALTNPSAVQRFGGLCLGESTHLVNDVDLFVDRIAARHHGRSGRAFLLAERGRLTLPVWVDHVGSAGTRHVTGDLRPDWPLDRRPDVKDMPRIEPP